MSRSRTGAMPAGARLGISKSSRLARRAAVGDGEAFAEIFRRHHQELYRYCLAIVHDREDAEDAVQATMAAALRALPGDDREIALRPWLYRVAHNESISLLRGRRTGVDPERIEEAKSLPPEVELADRDRLRQLVSDIRELPDRQRSAIVMRELSDLSYEDIGLALSSTEAAARQTVYEARIALHELEEGREMECEVARQAISSHDRRRLRGRRVRSHLRSCDACLAFEASIGRRREDLQALCPPLPALAAAGLLSGLIGSGAGGAGGGTAAVGAGGAAAGTGAAGIAGTGAAGIAGAGAAGSLAVKGASLAAAVAVAAGAADVGGVIDLPRPLGGGGDSGIADPNPPADRSSSSVAAEQDDLVSPADDVAATPDATGSPVQPDEGRPGADGEGLNAPGGEGGGPGTGSAVAGPGNSAPAPGHEPGRGSSADAAARSGSGHGSSTAARDDKKPKQSRDPKEPKVKEPKVPAEPKDNSSSSSSDGRPEPAVVEPSTESNGNASPLEVPPAPGGSVTEKGPKLK